jgi:tRNA1Val (adenine37-N6)-methyltransferase
MGGKFSFKQFEIQQDQCAMKIGTDGVLLGAWTSIEQNPETILDVGAGTGIIALMMAQREPMAQIDGLELDTEAYVQCVENFEASPWGDRLFCYHASFQEFMEEMDEPYDLIISNPPFYSEGISSGNEARDIARKNEALPFEVLIKGAERLLSVQGQLSVIIPYAQEENIISIGQAVHLYPERITRVKGSQNTDVKRSLIQFSRNKKVCLPTHLTIEVERHVYTKEYEALVKDFYLKM